MSKRRNRMHVAGKRASKGESTTAYDVHGNLGVQVGDHNAQYFTLPSPLSPGWPVRIGVPPALADRYQHRNSEKQLAEALTSGGVAVVVGTGRAVGVVMAGLGGVGKSQLAAHHAWAAWLDESVDLVVWVNAVSRTAIVTAYADAARRVLSGVDPLIVQRSPEEAAAAFSNWLVSTRRRWLIVLDDLQDPVDLRRLWPPYASAGQVVVTTRRRDVALERDDRHVIEVGVFSAAESLAYLEAKLPKYAATEGGTEQLRALAAELGYLPLALAQASAFIADKPLLSVAAYRERLADRRMKLAEVMPAEADLSDEHHATVTVTWSLSIEHADALAPCGFARPLLEVIALLDPVGIPVSVLTSEPLLSYLADVTKTESDGETVGDALGCLSRLSLITLDSFQGESAIRTHSLLQRAVRETLEPERMLNLARVTGDALTTVWPEIDSDTVLTQALRSSASTLHANTVPALWIQQGHDVLFRVGRSLREVGLPEAAVTYLEQLLFEVETLYGPDDLDALTVRNDLAASQGEAGNLAGAVAAFESLLGDTERVKGRDHPDTLVARSNLAAWKGRSGDVGAAVADFERLLPDFERVLGVDHPDTLTVRNCLAAERSESGDVAGAVIEFERLLADIERVQGPDHPDTLIVRSNLASCRGETGDAAGALVEMERLLLERRRLLGDDHPKTLLIRGNLAVFRGESGDAARAVAELDQLLGDVKRVLGPDHPTTLGTIHDLAFWRGYAGDVGSAVAGLECLLAEVRRVLGPDHPYVLVVQGNLIFWRGEAGDTAEVVSELECLLANQIRILGADHPGNLATRNNIASWRGSTGDLDGAVAELECLLVDVQRILGPDHPKFLTTLGNLAAYRGEAGNAEAAVVEFERLLVDQIRILGADHPDALNTRNNIAFWRVEMGDFGGAAGVLEQLLPDVERVLGICSSEALSARVNLELLQKRIGRVR